MSEEAGWASRLMGLTRTQCMNVVGRIAYQSQDLASIVADAIGAEISAVDKRGAHTRSACAYLTRLTTSSQ